MKRRNEKKKERRKEEEEKEDAYHKELSFYIESYNLLYKRKRKS